MPAAELAARFPGRLVVIEGPDGAGKTTVTDGVQAELEARGVEVLRLREPGTTALGEQLRAILKGEIDLGEDLDDRAEALLFAAARAQLVAHVIRPALERGAWVLLDRHTVSTLVYQGIGRGLGVKRMLDLCSFAVNGVTPDLNVVLTVSAETASQRMGVRDGEVRDRIEGTGTGFLSVVREGYAQVAVTEPNTVTVPADGSREEVLALVLAAIDARL